MSRFQPPDVSSAITPLACRPLNATAASACAELHRSGFASPWATAEFESLLASASVIADGIGTPGPLKGFVLSRRAADEAEILSIAVDPSARKKGLATTLLGSHISRLSRNGVAALFLEVDVSNAPALALYRRFGFREVGKRPAYYARPDGTRANALILKLDL